MNQSYKQDAGKIRLTLVPRKIIWAIGWVREYGTSKYKDPDNWKKVEKDRYKDAAFRHFLAYLENPKSIDKESGIPHLYHLACNIAFLCDMEEYNFADALKNDDRATKETMMNKQSQIQIKSPETAQMKSEG